MAERLNRHAFEKLIAENIEWLRAMPDCLEKDHTLQILHDSPRMYYDVERENAELRRLLTRYRNETPIGNQPHMICAEVDEILKNPH